MEYNDYELVTLAHEHNEDAINILYDKYRPLIIGKAKEVYKNIGNKGVELADMIQEAMIGFEEAIRDYNQDDKAIFYTFVCVCIDRQLMSAALKFSRGKHKILNEAISFDGLADENNILDFIPDNSSDPFLRIVSMENKEEIRKSAKKILTDYEYKVFEYRIQGYNNKDIAIMLNKDSKAIGNTIQRIRMKISKIKESW